MDDWGVCFCLVGSDDTLVVVVEVSPATLETTVAVVGIDESIVAVDIQVEGFAATTGKEACSAPAGSEVAGIKVAVGGCCKVVVDVEDVPTGGLPTIPSTTC